MREVQEVGDEGGSVKRLGMREGQEVGDEGVSRLGMSCKRSGLLVADVIKIQAASYLCQGLIIALHSINSIMVSW